MKNEYVKVLIHRPDDGVSIMCFMTKTRLDGENAVLDHWTEHETDKGWYVREASTKNIEAEIRRSNIDFVSFDLIDEAAIPVDRTFRNAWTKCPINGVKIDMDKARVIHMDRIRAARDERLTELDKRKYGSDHDDERQRLRDIPQTFNLSKANTPEELKALWPTELT